MTNPTLNLHPVIQYGLRQSDAIKCLRLSNHTEATLILLYAAIDHMAWLSIKGEATGSNGFKAWVEKYMLAHNADRLAGATSTDLWGARCGIIHTASPESNDYRKGDAKRIYYYSNLPQDFLHGQNVIVLSLERLNEAFAAGLLFFLEDLEADETQDLIARDKFARMLKYYAV